MVFLNSFLKPAKVTVSLLSVFLLLSNFNLDAKHHSKGQECGTNIRQIINNNPLYTEIDGILSKNVIQTFTDLTNAMFAAGNEASYDALYNYCLQISQTIPNGRVVLAQQDAGLVIVDTSKPFDPTNLLATGNSYAHWQSNTVNSSNHNTRLSILFAQFYPCGIGAETALSATLRMPQAGVAKRLTPSKRDYTQSTGTVRLSQVPVLPFPSDPSCS
jgi:hypothetical protein